MIARTRDCRGPSRRARRVGRWIGLAACCTALVSAQAQNLRIGGTGGALATVQRLADAYRDQHPGTRIEVLPSLGSSGGIKALLSDAIAIAVSSRPLQPAEATAGAQAIEYARTPFVFATAKSNATDGLTLDGLVAIYAGRDTHWPDGTPIRLVLRPAGDSDSEMINSMSPAMREATLLAEQRENTAFAVTDQDAAQSLETIPGALGPSTLAQILAEDRALKVLRLDGVAPAAQTIADGRYPYYKPMYLITTADTPPAARQFIAFVRSAPGRAILERTGHWVP